jgi:hypothetical protein
MKIDFIYGKPSVESVSLELNLKEAKTLRDVLASSSKLYELYDELVEELGDSDDGAKVMVRYEGACDSQVNWGGNADPRGILQEGAEYELDHEEVHSFHTKYILSGYPGKKFNSVSFSPSRIGDGYEAYSKKTSK